MSSPIRTAFVGIGVIAICICMASLKGHHLLMAFAAASLLCGIWSWMQHFHKSKPPAPALEEEPVRSRTRPNNGATVYQFPSRVLHVSDASS